MKIKHDTKNEKFSSTKKEENHLRRKGCVSKLDFQDFSSKTNSQLDEFHFPSSLVNYVLGYIFQRMYSILQLSITNVVFMNCKEKVVVCPSTRILCLL